MEKIKHIKQADLILQALALAAGIGYGIAAGEHSFIFAYFAVGAVQVLSFMVQWAISGTQGLTPARRRYGKFLLVIGGLLAVGFLFLEALFILVFVVLIALLFAAPFIAIAYWTVCYSELKFISNENEQ